MNDADEKAKLDYLKRKMCAAKGRAPSVQELVIKSGHSESRILELTTTVNTLGKESAEQENSGRFQDIVARFIALINQDEHLLKALSSREKAIVVWRCGLDGPKRSLSEIASLLKCKESSVAMSECRALITLEKAIAKKNSEEGGKPPST